jgi:hypothetical protein
MLAVLRTIPNEGFSTIVARMIIVVSIRGGM